MSSVASARSFDHGPAMVRPFRPRVVCAVGERSAPAHGIALSPSDNNPLNALMEEHRPTIVRQALRACGDVHTAEDIAQDVLLKLMRILPVYRAEQPISHWIARTTTTTTIDALRRRRGDASIDEGGLRQQLRDLRLDAADSAHRSIEAATVRAAILRLPPKLREVVWMTTYQDLTHREVAECLGLPLRTVMSRSVAARSALRRSLQSLEAVG